jgi:hypothetical protein
VTAPALAEDAAAFADEAAAEALAFAEDAAPEAAASAEEAAAETLARAEEAAPLMALLVLLPELLEHAAVAMVSAATALTATAMTPRGVRKRITLSCLCRSCDRT